jgi:sRNA-binding protein
MMQKDPTIEKAIADFGREVTEKYPKAFPSGKGAWSRIVPLKIGILNDLTSAHPDVPAVIAKAFIARHTRSGLYLKGTCVAGKPRVDLEGREVGIVSPKDAAYSKKCVSRRYVRGKIDRAKNRIINKDISVDDCAKKLAKRYKVFPFESMRARLLNALPKDPAPTIAD